MAISLEKVEALAPDQASLAAARPLLKSSLWPTLAEAEGLCWGECQGSGATPYRVVVSEVDHGYKCTCPSRKFPCKHSLALMWIRAEGKLAFASSAVPEWVKDWRSRRRPDNKPGNQEFSEEAPNERATRPSVGIVQQPETPKKADPQAEARSAAARERNRAGREAAILEGLSHLDTWLSDQIDRGMVNFVTTCNQTCRAIAQRLVDTKAPGLASRLDALPTRLFTLTETARPHAAIRELGQIHLVSAAYRRTSELDEGLAADARQAVGWPVTRETLLADLAAVRLRSRWTVFAVVTEAQPDRLRRIETWLYREQPARDDDRDEAPHYAVLIDFVPVSGSAAGGYVMGDQLEAELVYYRSSVPLRAVIAGVQQGAQPSSRPVPAATGTLADAYLRYTRALQALPWLGSFPLSFREATVRRRHDQLYLCDQQLALPVHASQQTQALPLTGAGPLEGIGLWNGYELTLACAETPLGRWVRG